MTTTATPQRARRRRSRLRTRNTLLGWSFILPNFLGFATLTLVPVIVLFYMSLTNWNIFGTSQFIGLDNFTRLAADGSFRTAFVNTIYYSALHIPLTIIVSLALALLLNSKICAASRSSSAQPRSSRTSRRSSRSRSCGTCCSAPTTAPSTRCCGSSASRTRPGWLTDTNWSMPAVVIISTWKDMGYYMVLFLAALQTVPRELHEAARMDGANVFQRFLNVTLPGLRPRCSSSR